MTVMPPEPPSTTTELPFEAIVARLETIATQLETGDAKLEAALALFEEGVQLSKRGAHRLDAAERKLEMLLESGQTETLSENQVLVSPKDAT